MLTKICSKCLTPKKLTEFYKHPKTKDGYLNKCKKCSKEYTKIRYDIKSNDKDWLESERVRHAEKYHRLGYKDLHKENMANKKWFSSSIYLNLHRDLKLPKNVEAHHWNYSDNFLRDIIIMTRSEHRKAHKYLIFDEEKLIFTTLDKIYLDTKDKHI